MRLLGVELRRLLARQAVRWLALVVLLLPALYVWQASALAQPMSAEQLAQAEADWAAAQQDWEENGDEIVTSCLEEEQRAREETGEDLDYMCEEQAPQREWYFFEPPPLEEYLPSALQTGMWPLGLVAVLLGVTLVAAEFTTGAMGTWLTFEPRRGRVLASKTAAVALAGLALGAVWSVLVLGATWLGYAIAGTGGGLQASDALPVLRGALLGAAVAVIGAGLGFLLRHTAAAIGIAIGYVIAIDGLVLNGGMIPGGGRWSLLTNASAWYLGEASYYEQVCRTEPEGGTICEGVERVVTATQGGFVVLGVVALVTALAWLTFRRRDV